MLVASANDACQALADAGAEPALSAAAPHGFVQRMNRRAEALGLTATRFRNPCGFDAVGQVDLAKGWVSELSLEGTAKASGKLDHKKGVLDVTGKGKAEVKRRSPSKGDLFADLDPAAGLDAGPRKGCKVHGKGDFIKKVRV